MSWTAATPSRVGSGPGVQRLASDLFAAVSFTRFETLPTCDPDFSVGHGAALHDGVYLVLLARPRPYSAAQKRTAPDEQVAGVPCPAAIGGWNPRIRATCL